MKCLGTISECRTERASLGRVALVATMGALHEGHISLMQIAREHADHGVVSIFVNPTQFGPTEDLSRYPRPIDEDLEICRAAGMAMVFNPSAGEMYPARAPQLLLDMPDLTGALEGRHRPGHFKGVCQVVTKLFNIIRPDAACFGQKDYQQLRVIQAMTEALDFDIRIIPCPTVREPDGLAMSSRNRYLSPEERRRALAINRGLSEAEAQVRQGVRQTNRLTAGIQRELLAEHINMDYVAAVDPLTLRPVELITGPTLLAVAGRVGATRLIDNRVVGP